MKYPTSPINLQTRDVPSPFLRRACRILLRSFATIPHLNALFSIACSLFSKNTRVGGSSAPDHPLLTTHLFQAFIFNILRIPTNPSSTQKPFILIHLQIPFRATLLFSHLYKSPRWRAIRGSGLPSASTQRTLRLCVISSANLRRKPRLQ